MSGGKWRERWLMSLCVQVQGAGGGARGAAAERDRTHPGHKLRLQGPARDRTGHVGLFSREETFPTSRLGQQQLSTAHQRNSAQLHLALPFEGV